MQNYCKVLADLLNPRNVKWSVLLPVDVLVLHPNLLNPSDAKPSVPPPVNVLALPNASDQGSAE